MLINICLDFVDRRSDESVAGGGLLDEVDLAIETVLWRGKKHLDVVNWKIVFLSHSTITLLHIPLYKRQLST